jgi:hypothetical protein
MLSRPNRPKKYKETTIPTCKIGAIWLKSGFSFLTAAAAVQAQLP